MSKFQPGQSGNPKGRPKSTLTASDLRAKLAGNVDQVLEVVVQAALGGDMQAARIILERLIPAIKPIEKSITLEIPETGTLTEQGRAVLAAVASGEIAPSQGSALVGAIGTLARVVEVDDLVKRIEALEERNEP